MLQSTDLKAEGLGSNYAAFSEPSVDKQIDKIQTTLSAIEKAAPNLGDRVDIGTISFGCALGYLDLCFEDLGWRDHYPAAGEWYARFDERQSMRETRLR